MTRCLGIDFGTAYSLAACVNAEGVPEIIPNPADPAGNILLPSVAAVREDGRTVVGWDAREFAQSSPERTIASIKRLLDAAARSLTQEQAAGFFPLSFKEGEGFCLERAGRLWTPLAFAALIFKEIKDHAEEIRGESFSSAVVSVPVHFQADGRQSIREAAAQAGFKTIELITDAEAALLACAPKLKNPAAGVAVYDFGGGMFDFSIVRLQNGRTEILANAGDSFLGGIDIDRSIAAKILREISESRSENLSGDRIFAARVLEESEKAKCALSHRGSYDFRLADEKRGIQYRRAFSRFELADLAADFVERTAELCAQAMKQAGLPPEKIDEVILAGGLTRMPLVRDCVTRAVGKKNEPAVNPDQIVALGAAVRAAAS